ncbi:MAG TPA: AMP-binding protein [Candidatus Limiplasma sp.]|nr:AMP-binding protein [Candidatus Limiplasma sp.]HPS81804.1 AMP-binding protein [Candidatus Limiplasma sp.]
MKPLYLNYLDCPVQYATYDDFNKRFHIRRPESFNFAYDVADRIALEEPDRTAVLWTDETGACIRYTFGMLKEESDRAANLLATLGIAKGDKVMLILRRHLQFWPIIMALHKIGAVAVPATHLLTEKDIVYRVNAAGIKAAIISDKDSAVLDAAEVAREKCATLKTLVVLRGERKGFTSYEQALLSAPAVWKKPEGEAYPKNHDPMLLYFTSGTTGMPKMVTHDYYYPLGHIVTSLFWQQCIDGGLHFTISETGWAKSVWGKLYGQWLTGSAVFVYDFERFVAKDVLRQMSEHHVTSFCAPPTMYRYILQENFADYDLSALKHCAVAGEPLNPDMAAEWLKRTGISLLEAFGQTELVVTLATFPFMKVCPGSMGKPSPIFDVDIIDDEGNSCPAGITGEIVVRTDSDALPIGMFTGYYENPDLTKTVWDNGIYHTGDTAWRDEWGYYWYVGRADDVIKSSGYRIGPFEVESALLEHPAVLETAITAAPDPLRGSVVKATIVLKPGFAPSDELKIELQEHVKHITAPYKYPRIIEFVSELPKTISGKIRRVELREKDQQNAR